MKNLSLVIILRAAKAVPSFVVATVECRGTPENPDGDILCAGIKEPKWGRERGIIGAVMSNDGNEREVCIYDSAEPDPRHHDIEDRTIGTNREDKDKEACQKENKGRM